MTEFIDPGTEDFETLPSMDDAPEDQFELPTGIPDDVFIDSIPDYEREATITIRKSWEIHRKLTI